MFTQAIILLLITFSLVLVSKSLRYGFDDGNEAPEEDDSTADSSTIGALLTKRVSDWNNAVIAKDLASIKSLFFEDSVSYPPNEEVLVGLDRFIYPFWWLHISDDKDFFTVWTVDSASGSGHLGYTTGSYVTTFLDKGGCKIIQNGKFVVVWEGRDANEDGIINEKDDWRMLKQIWN